MPQRSPARRPLRAQQQQPAQQLAPRTSHVLQNVVVSAAVTGLAFGALPLAGYPGWRTPALIVGSLGTILLGVFGYRAQLRNDLHDRLVEALSPSLGVRQPDRRTVRASRWTRGFPGHPSRVTIRYAPAIADAAPTWKATIVSIVSSRLATEYEVASHDLRKCRLQLRSVSTSSEPAGQKSFARARAERAITELMGATANVTDAQFEGEALTAFSVTHQAGAKLAASGYRNRVERVISTMMPGRWRAVWDLECDTARFEIRPSLPASVWLPPEVPANVADLLRNYRDVRVPFAVDEDGQELAWYPARVPQTMLTGGTGTGKTSTAHALLGKVTQYGWPVWVLDAKRVEFLPFRDWPNVQIVATTVPQQVALIRRVWRLMEYRYRLIEEGRATVNDFEPLVVFLDEFAEFRSNLTEWYGGIKVKGDPTKPSTLAETASLARKARTARIHVVLSTQRPDAEFLGGEMRDNFGQRMSMGRLSPQGALMMWENPSTGVSLPRSCIGRMTATNDAGLPVEAQAYRFPDMDSDPGSEEQLLLEKLRPAAAKHERLLIVPPEPETNLDGDDVLPITFQDYANAQWVLAKDRPDIDPLTAADRMIEVDARMLSSPQASLGLLGSASPLADIGTAPALVVDEPSTATIGSPDVDDYEGYAAPVPVSPRDLVIGDLIEVDEGSGIWVVIDEMPEDDFASPGCIAISWRGDGDESGSLSVPDEDALPARRPEEDM